MIRLRRARAIWSHQRKSTRRIIGNWIKWMGEKDEKRFINNWMRGMRINHKHTFAWLASYLRCFWRVRELGPRLYNKITLFFNNITSIVYFCVSPLSSSFFNHWQISSDVRRNNKWGGRLRMLSKAEAESFEGEAVGRSYQKEIFLWWFHSVSSASSCNVNAISYTSQVTQPRRWAFKNWCHWEVFFAIARINYHLIVVDG